MGVKVVRFYEDEIDATSGVYVSEVVTFLASYVLATVSLYIIILGLSSLAIYLIFKLGLFLASALLSIF